MKTIIQILLTTTLFGCGGDTKEGSLIYFRSAAMERANYSLPIRLEFSGEMIDTMTHSTVEPTILSAMRRRMWVPEFIVLSPKNSDEMRRNEQLLEELGDNKNFTVTGNLMCDNITAALSDEPSFLETPESVEFAFWYSDGPFIAGQTYNVLPACRRIK